MNQKWRDLNNILWSFIYQSQPSQNSGKIGEVKLGQIIEFKKIIEVVLTKNFEKL